MSAQTLAEMIAGSFRELHEGSIVRGRILEIKPQVVLVDIGYKSEGAIPSNEFEDEEIEAGDYFGYDDDIEGAIDINQDGFLTEADLGLRSKREIAKLMAQRATLDPDFDSNDDMGDSDFGSHIRFRTRL